MPPTPEDQRARAQGARRRRAARIAQLRRRVVATAVTTFAVAVAAVAFDGSSGATSATTATTGDSTTAVDDGTAMRTNVPDSVDGSNAVADSGDAITTQQS